MGVENNLGGNWSGKLEYLYVDLGRVTSSLTFFAGGPGTIRTTSDIRDHVFRAGANYHFGGPFFGVY